MSTVKVNTISTWTGSDISIETGKTVSGTASQFKMTDVVQGDVLYGSAADTLSRLAPGTSGDHLQSGGAGANPSWVAPPAGGLTGAYTWRMESDYTGLGTTGTVLGNSVVWSLDDTAGAVSIGSTGSVTSGVFTFGATGLWKCDFYTSWTIGGSAPWDLVTLQTSANTGVAWTSRSQGAQAVHNGEYGSGTVSCLFDCENTTTHLLRVYRVSGSTDLDVIYQGDANINYTYVNFTKLGDT